MIWDLLILCRSGIRGPALHTREGAGGRGGCYRGTGTRTTRRTTDEMSYTNGYQTGYRAGQAESRLPPALWQRMLVLGHPDHHEGSPLQPIAAEVTRWLLMHRPKAGAEIHG